MTDLSDGRRFWLGGFWLGGQGWSWSDGTPWDYENWAPGEPSGDGDCLEGRPDSDGKWNDRGCNIIDEVHGDLGYVCKK